MKRTRLARTGALKRARVSRKSPRAASVAALDTLVAKIVRLRDGRCVWCRWEGREKDCGPLTTAHLLPKGRVPCLRFELENVLLLGFYHHLHVWHKHPALAMAWIEEYAPGKMARLSRISLARKGQRTDLKLTKLYLEAQLKTFEQAA